ncbi:hypothetical protein [Streptomyces sp. SID12501]|uniref:Uncharacterized protein n=1 Tax=Streptomyces sp. SID12501 TaxID=2706042 RepID=A0A6B3C6X1_9ACTN|nr:hypothetical protein [Streptomyces sp. SID12501]NEC92399.1 hypothetical protein [Streptomyces sp. SID12501]
MVRYVHHQLATIVEAGVAMAFAAPVVFGVRGLPRAESDKVLSLLGILGISTLFGLLAISVRSHWLGGEKRYLESVVPLTDPKATLPAPRESMRRSFDGSFVVFVALSSLVFGLLYDPWAIGWAVVFIPERIVKGVYMSSWERRHGVLVWCGKVEEQPLGKGQFLYSSARNTTPG